MIRFLETGYYGTIQYSWFYVNFMKKTHAQSAHTCTHACIHIHTHIYAGIYSKGKLNENSGIMNGIFSFY